MTGSDLHDLFEIATADLPPLPDLAPGARRIARRRRLIERSLGAVLCAALVIGAGTLALDSPWRSSFNAATALHDYKTHAAALLQEAWPVQGDIVMPAQGSSRFFQIVSPDGTVSPVTLDMLKIGSIDAACTPNTKLSRVCPTLSVSSVITTGHVNMQGPENPGDPGSTGDTAIVQYFHAGVLMDLYVYDEPGRAVSDAQLAQMLNAPQLMRLVDLAIADRQTTFPGETASAIPSR